LTSEEATQMANEAIRAIVPPTVRKAADNLAEKTKGVGFWLALEIVLATVALLQERKDNELCQTRK